MPGQSEGGEGKDNAVEGFSQAHTAVSPSAAANTAEIFWLVRVNENIIVCIYGNKCF